MAPTTAAQLVQGVEQLVSLPEACFRVNEMIEDPSSSAADFAAVITQDADLSARLLRLVNSAYYALPGPVDTISRAVTIVGTRELRDLAVMTAACDLFQGIPADMFNMSDFWHYAVATGIFARNLAAQCSALHAERLFVMGVLHDVGRLVIMQHLGQQARDILLLAQDKAELLSYAESEVLGFTHAEVGYELTRTWQLPESIGNAIRFHHQPAAAQSYRLETALIHIAQLMAHNTVWGEGPQQALGEIDVSVWGVTGLSPDSCRKCGSEAGQQIMGMFSVLMGADHSSAL